MKKGGYKIIDLTGVNFGVTSSIDYKKLYADLEKSYRKPILLTGILVNGEKKNDIFVTVEPYDELETNNAKGFRIHNIYGYMMDIYVDEDDIYVTETFEEKKPLTSLVKTVTLTSDDDAFFELDEFVGTTIMVEINGQQEEIDIYVDSADGSQLTNGIISRYNRFSVGEATLNVVGGKSKISISELASGSTATFTYSPIVGPYAEI